MNRRYELYVNGVLAKRFLTLQRAIAVAIKYFPSYIVDSQYGSVVWKGDK